MAIEQNTLSKAEIMDSLARLPDTATVEDFIEHLSFILGVQEGLADLEAGRTFSNDEVLARIKSWQK